MDKKERKIIIIDGAAAPEFVGAWTVGEVLAMAQQLAGWVERLQVSQPPDAAKETKHEQTKL